MTRETERPEDDQDPIRALVRLAGERPPVPPERLGRVRATALDEWNRQTARRGRWRRIRVAALLGVAASLLLLVAVRVLPPRGGGPGDAAGAIVVESTSGVAWFRPATDAASAPLELTSGATIPAGAELTTGEAGRAGLRLPTGHSLRLDVSTRVRLVADGLIALDEGSVYVDSGGDVLALRAVEVRTPLGVVREIGTRFEVRLEEASVRVRLREGAVVVRQAGRDHEVGVGMELQLDREGLAVRRAISTHGPDWDWTTDVAPMFGLEGRSARAFLEWYARERGFTLAFSEMSAARAASGIVLGGSAERLSADEALAAVLQTCRMTHRIDDGILLVSELP